MKKLLKLGRNNQVAGISTRNTRSDVVPEDTIDITDIEVPEDIKRNPQNWTRYFANLDQTVKYDRLRAYNFKTQ